MLIFKEILPGFFLIFDKLSDYLLFILGELVGAIIVLAAVWFAFS